MSCVNIVMKLEQMSVLNDLHIKSKPVFMQIILFIY